MSTFQSKRPRSKLPIFIVLVVIIIAALVAAGFYFKPRFESAPPQITFSPNVDVVGLAPLEIQVSDKGTGLKEVTATLSQSGTQRSLAAEQFAQPVGEKKFAVALAKVPGVKEGPAILRVTARDNALWRSNEAVIEKTITIDITPVSYTHLTLPTILRV